MPGGSASSSLATRVVSRLPEASWPLTDPFPCELADPRGTQACEETRLTLSVCSGVSLSAGCGPWLWPTAGNSLPETAVREPGEFNELPPLLALDCTDGVASRSKGISSATRNETCFFGLGFETAET